MAKIHGSKLTYPDQSARCCGIHHVDVYFCGAAAAWEHMQESLPLSASHVGSSSKKRKDIINEWKRQQKYLHKCMGFTQLNRRGNKHACLTRNQRVWLPLLPGCISNAWFFSAVSAFICSWFRPCAVMLPRINWGASQITVMITALVLLTKWQG